MLSYYQIKNLRKNWKKNALSLEISWKLHDRNISNICKFETITFKNFFLLYWKYYLLVRFRRTLMSRLVIVQITLAALTITQAHWIRNYPHLKPVHTEKNPRIVFIAETWFTELYLTTILNYSLHREDRRAGSVCIFIRNNL